MRSMLVLGGTSWLGGAVVHEAIRRGHEVTCLARGESGDAPVAATFVRSDRDEPGAYDEVMDRRWDAIVDAARSPRQVRSAVEALGGTASHWTLVSTGSVYADQSGPLTEDSPTADPVDDPGDEDYGAGKVACERSVRDLPHHLVVRAGLIGGPGDRSDRLGHYVARFALAGDEPVLVPDVADQPMQVVDVRDLATWIVVAAESRVEGVVHGVGVPSTVGELVRLSSEVAAFEGEQVLAPPDWLREHDVEEWMGPRSLPLWLPDAYVGMGLMDDGRAREHGLERRPLADTLRDVLADERERGLDRERRAGLSRADELELLADLSRRS